MVPAYCIGKTVERTIVHYAVTTVLVPSVKGSLVCAVNGSNGLIQKTNTYNTDVMRVFFFFFLSHIIQDD